MPYFSVATSCPILLRRTMYLMRHHEVVFPEETLNPDWFTNNMDLPKILVTGSRYLI